MQSALIEELLNIMNMKLFGIVLQLIIVGAILMWLKDFTGKILDFFKIKFSDFGRGTRLEICGKVGKIRKVGFSEVELEVTEGDMIIPVNKFAKEVKVILNERG